VGGLELRQIFLGIMKREDNSELNYYTNKYQWTTKDSKCKLFNSVHRNMCAA